jgi:hypothetical protein
LQPLRVQQNLIQPPGFLGKVSQQRRVTCDLTAGGDKPVGLLRIQCRFTLQPPRRRPLRYADQPIDHNLRRHSDCDRHDHSELAYQTSQRLKELRFSRHVQHAGCFIENQQQWTMVKGSRKTDAVALPAGKTNTPLAHVPFVVVCGERKTLAS